VYELRGCMPGGRVRSYHFKQSERLPAVSVLSRAGSMHRMRFLRKTVSNKRDYHDGIGI
jgi:hypothetical protein